MRLQGKTVMNGYKRHNNERTAAVDDEKWKGRSMKEKVEKNMVKEQPEKMCRIERDEGDSAGKVKRRKFNGKIGRNR
jgi:hypothetical protein